MKKSLFILLAIITIAFSSCVENDAPSNIESINLDLFITPFDTGTKAMKTGWVNGDKLNIWFAPSYSDYDCKTDDPDLIITYNEGAWTAGQLRDGVNLGTYGRMFMVYEGHNNIGLYKNVYSNGTAAFELKEVQTITPNYPSFCTPLIVINDGGGSDGVMYSFNQETKTLSATVTSGWRFYTQFKVLIKGLNPTDANKYHLQVQAYGSTIMYPTVQKGFKIYESGEMDRNYSSNSNGWTGGVPDTDGVAFYYCQAYGWNNVDITFSLRKYTSNILVESKQYLVLSPKTINNTDAQMYCDGVYVNYSQFN